MNKILIFAFISFFFIPFAFPQNGDHVRGGRFSKLIEYNLLWLENGYNLNSKGDFEKLVFGGFNAPIEFFFSPSSEYVPEVPSGFRIIKDTLKKVYILEIKRIPNFREALKEAYSNYPLRGVSSVVSIPKDTLGEIVAQNRENIKNASEAVLKLYTVDSRSFPISNQFAEKLYEKMVSLINNFKARGVPPHFVDGYSVSFRTVVDDEVWSLKIHIPKGKALKMSDFCRQIIKDAYDNKLDEASYIKTLEDF